MPHVSSGTLKQAGDGSWYDTTQDDLVLQVPNIFIGADIGLHGDPSAYFVLAEPLWDYEKKKWCDISEYSPGTRDTLLKLNHATVERFKPDIPPLFCRDVRRLPLLVDGPFGKRKIKPREVAQRLSDVVNNARRYGRVVLLVDRGGGGEGVIEHLEHWGHSPWKVAISGKFDAVEHDDNYVSIPHRLLFGKLGDTLWEGRIHFPADLPFLEDFIEEVGQVEIIEDGSDNVSYKLMRRNGNHADMMAAAALSLWGRQRYWNSVDEMVYECQEWRRDNLDPFAVEYYNKLGNMVGSPGPPILRKNTMSRSERANREAGGISPTSMHNASHPYWN
jgi:hypothetical protein